MKTRTKIKVLRGYGEGIETFRGLCKSVYDKCTLHNRVYMQCYLSKHRIPGKCSSFKPFLLLRLIHILVFLNGWRSRSVVSVTLQA